MASRKAKQVREFGDFQTPSALAGAAASLVRRNCPTPRTVLEPTCGRGTFLAAAGTAFPNAERFIGLEINETHLDYCRRRIVSAPWRDRVTLHHGDFFALDWGEVLADLPEPILIIGNPPWVTSAELGMLGSGNLPAKSNFQGRSGMEALTGKSNFDISEWMLLKNMEWLQNRGGVLGMLCKTSVARKVLAHAWSHDRRIAWAGIHRIDASEHFQAAVDACFLVVDCASHGLSKNCAVHESLDDPGPSHAIGYRDGTLVADVESYGRHSHLRGLDRNHVWRSGLKHDCSKVMELTCRDGALYNGFGREVNLEDTYVFPLYKSSDVGNGRIDGCRKRVIVTQRTVGADTAEVARNAPRTWKYLEENRSLLDGRASSIYRNRPPFSVFGVGDYTFAPWKVAISGFYKKLDFKVVAPVADKPAVFDDTIYFLACASAEEARFLAGLLNSPPAREFLESMIFWTEKRPVTADLLKRLNIQALARQLGRRSDYDGFVKRRLAGSRGKDAPSPTRRDRESDSMSSANDRSPTM